MAEPGVIVIENNSEIAAHVVEITQFLDLPVEHFHAQGEWLSRLEDSKEAPLYGDAGELRLGKEPAGDVS